MMFARKNRAQVEPILGITGWFLLDDGRYCEYGNTESGLGVDVYEDQSRQKLVNQLRHFHGTCDGEDMLKALVEYALEP